MRFNNPFRSKQSLILLAVGAGGAYALGFGSPFLQGVFIGVIITALSMIVLYLYAENYSPPKRPTNRDLSSDVKIRRSPDQ